ncbi:hypothetical protein [Mycolicibacterium porcinum]
MQITGAFLAESAEVVDGKLNVSGGVLDWIGVPRRGEFDDAGNMAVGLVYLVTLMQATPDDHRKPYRMTTEMVDSDGTSHVVADSDVEIDAHTGENRFWVTPIGVAAERSGRMVLIQSIDGGGSVSIPVELRVE